MTAVTVSFRWLDILEKEFDKAFVDLDLIVGDLSEYDDCEEYSKAQTRLHALSSCFAQLTHKAQTIFQSNAKLEAELVHLRGEAAESRAQLQLSRQQQQRLKDRMHQLQPDAAADTEEEQQTEDEVEKLKQEWQGASEELSESQQRVLSMASEAAVTEQLTRENAALRRLLLGMQGELCGARLAAKYLDKELAGRIQQLQLLGREVRWQQDHDKLWRQLEAEINLHRHKTVVRACRANIPAHNGMQSACEPPSIDGCPLLPVGATQEGPRPDPSRYSRTITITKSRAQSLGMSVTGGREHGVPIVVSVVHPNTPASLCGDLFVGDAILSVDGQDLTQMSHTEAVALLSRPAETVTLELMFVPPEDEDTSSLADDPFAFKYRVFDDDVVSVASSAVVCGLPRSHLRTDADGRLSRASLDSIRGSEDNLDTRSDGLSDSHSNCGSVISGDGARLGDHPSRSIANSEQEIQQSVTQSFSQPLPSAALEKQHPESEAPHGGAAPLSPSNPGSSIAGALTSERHSSVASDSCNSPADTRRPSSTMQQLSQSPAGDQDNTSQPEDSSPRKRSDAHPASQHTLRSYSCTTVSQDPPTPVHRRSVPCYPGTASPVLPTSRASSRQGSSSVGGAVQVINGLTEGSSGQLRDRTYSNSSRGEHPSTSLPQNESSQDNKSAVKKKSTPLLQTPLQEIEQQMTTALPDTEGPSNTPTTAADASNTPTTAADASNTPTTAADVSSPPRTTEAALFNSNY